MNGASIPEREARNGTIDGPAAAFLLGRVAARDEQAFAMIHRAMGRRVYAYALRLVRSHEEAEEVVSDTMFEVWKNAHRFDGRSRFSTWVLGIARHRALDRLRSPLRAMDAVKVALDESMPGDETAAFDMITATERAVVVRDCLDKLSGVHRECLHLVFNEGASLADVATVQGCPLNTVKTRLFHARQKLRLCLRVLRRAEASVRVLTASSA